MKTCFVPYSCKQGCELMKFASPHIRLLGLLLLSGLIIIMSAVSGSSAQDNLKPPQWVGIYSTSGKAGLKWSRVDGAARYKVYRSISSGRGHSLVATTTDVSFIDPDVKPGETYYYVLKSVSPEGKESEYSDERHIKIPPGVGGGIPVAPPEWVGALVEQKRINLTWVPSQSSNTLAYNIYRSGAPDKGFQLIGSTQDTSFTDTDVKEGGTYYYALTTLDKEFKETKFSEVRQVSFVMPETGKAAVPKRGEAPPPAPEKIIAKPTKIVRFITQVKEGVPLNSPTDIDIDKNGNLYVADTGSSTIYVFDKDGGYLRSIGGYGKEDGKFEKLLGVDVDGSGSVFAADAYRGRLQKFDSKGTLTMVVNMAKDAKAIAKDLGLKEDLKGFGIVKVLEAPDGRLYAIDNFNNCIVIYSSNGTYIKTFGGQGTKEGKFQGPTFAMFDNEGDLFISDCFNARVQVFSQEGEFKWSFGSYGNILGTFSRPKGLCTDADGRIYVADSMANTVQVFNGQGGFLYILGDERGRQMDLGTPNGIVVDGKRKIYMVEKLLNRVQIRQIGD
jgi:DNA-binding beta-propeller fold protein YncE